MQAADFTEAASVVPVAELLAENARLRNEIDCACNALTDSICVSGNDRKTNLAWVKKLRAATLGDELKEDKP